MQNWAEFETSRKESGLGWVARTLMMALGMLVGFTMFSSPANAQTAPSADQIEDAYSNDPLGLIAYSEASRIYSISESRPDRLEVWACETQNENGMENLRVNPTQIVEKFREVALPYFAWLSNGLYVPEFLEGGTVTAPDDTDCHDAVKDETSRSGDITGVIIMTDTEGVQSPWSNREGVTGYAGPGVWCASVEDCPKLWRWPQNEWRWPQNDRYAVIRSNRAAASNGAHDRTLVHEIGHMLDLPHSFVSPSDEYSNRMDILSGGTIRTGTLAINRYAAGWMPESQVEKYPVSESDSQSGALYELSSLGTQGTQMLVLPIRPGEFYTLGARIRSDYDYDISAKGEGVEVYVIDQSLIDGESLIGEPDRCHGRNFGVCMGLGRGTKPFVATVNSGDPFGHVYGVGDAGIELDDARNIWFRVLEKDRGRYKVWVGPGPLRGKFYDDEGSVHEGSIDLLAESGITEGCDKENDYRFCPQNKVTRAQMVAFLGRALGLTATTGDGTFTANFSDVNPGSEYAGYLDQLGLIASGYPDGTFRPSQPITRGETAIMLNKALKLDANENRNTFTDVPPGTELATAAANLVAAGVTRGCATEPEPLFCPDDFLTRGQMATLLVLSPFPSEASSDDDDGEVQPDGREVRISWGTDASGRDRCPQGAVCRNYRYELTGFGSAPYTLECWIDGRLGWSGTWSGRPERGCWASGSTQTVVHVVVDGVKSNELLWVLSDDREIRISVGTDASGRDECPQGTVCRNYRYEWIGDFGPGPYTLECWGRAAYMDKSRLMWSGNWSGDPATGCYSWGSGHTVHVVVDGVKSNELFWSEPNRRKVQPDDDDREVRISVGKPSTRCPEGEFCGGLHRDYHYEFTGDFGPGPYTLECWIDGRLGWSGIWSGRPERGCWASGSGQTVHVVVDGVKSNELLWDLPDDIEVQSDDKEVRISWGTDASGRDGCPQGAVCRNYRYELTGFGPAPYTLECWIDGRLGWSGIWLGRPERGCWASEFSQTVHVVVDDVESNELRWP